MDELLKLMRGTRHIFTSDDDEKMMGLIESTHADNHQVVNVDPLLQLAQSLKLGPKEKNVSPTEYHARLANQMELLKKATPTDTFKALTKTIHNISCEVSCKCSGELDTYSTMSLLFNTVSTYSWDAKVVLVLAAFSVTYGKFLGVPNISMSSELNKVIKGMIDVTERVTQCDTILRKLQLIYQKKRKLELYNSSDMSVTNNTDIRKAAYWIVRSVVSCAPLITALVGLGDEYSLSINEKDDLSRLRRELEDSDVRLKKLLARYGPYLVELETFRDYKMIWQLFKRIDQADKIDNMTILNALLRNELLDDSTQELVEELKKEHVLLLISDLDIAHKDYRSLAVQYSKCGFKYKVVWIPVVDSDSEEGGSDRDEQLFEQVKSDMKWYSVHYKQLRLAAIRYIKQEWHFKKKPILVALNPQGRVTNSNAFHMFRIWGYESYDALNTTELDLWGDVKWGLQFLFGNIDDDICSGIKEEKELCLYGGENIDWIKKFITQVRNMEKNTNLKFEMTYVASSNTKKQVQQEIKETVTKLGSEHLDNSKTEALWVRLETIWHSKMQTQISNYEDDYQINQDITALLTFKTNAHGWALFSRGPTTMTIANGEMILTCFQNYDSWSNAVVNNGFVRAISRYINDPNTKPPAHCNRFSLSSAQGRIPEKICCPDCTHPMEKSVTFRCCTD